MQALAKPVRLRNQATIHAIREQAERKCEYEHPETGERCDHQADGEPHHIRTRGAGGGDIRENLIQLCGLHHRMFHDGNLSRDEFIRIVAKREGKTPDEIGEAIGLEVGEVPAPQQADPALQDLVHAFIQVDENEQEARFTKGQLLDAMLGMGATQKFLSSEIGVSPAQIRELVHVYRAFPNPTSRIPSLSWYHHRVASHSSAPAKFIAEAADQKLSTRELRGKILESEGANHLVEEDKFRELKKAEKLLANIKNLLDAGGEAAQWLLQEIKLIGEEGS